METNIIDICNIIYATLGTSHNECVYQKALIIELYNHGASSVEFEKNVPVFFEDSKGTLHTIGSERIDLLVRFRERVVLIELKAQSTGIREHVEVAQLQKYIKALAFLNIDIDIALVINFPQNCKQTSNVEFKSFNKIS
tara:strand:+ start:252 stop:668 length:417 start_codon:yes stop_codon:yes gene_type:complete